MKTCKQLVTSILLFILSFPCISAMNAPKTIEELEQIAAKAYTQVLRAKKSNQDATQLEQIAAKAYTQVLRAKKSNKDLTQQPAPAPITSGTDLQKTLEKIDSALEKNPDVLTKVYGETPGYDQLKAEEKNTASPYTSDAKTISKNAGVEFQRPALKALSTGTKVGTAHPKTGDVEAITAEDEYQCALDILKPLIGEAKDDIGSNASAAIELIKKEYSGATDYLKQ